MTSITTEKRGGTVRINIPMKEFSRLVPEDSNHALVKHWIEIGRERENLRDHIDDVFSTRFSAQKDEIDGLRREVSELQNMLESFVAFFSQVSHSVMISTTARSQFDLESIHFEKKNGGQLSHEDEQTYNLAKLKHTIFKQLLEQYFPEIAPRFNLTNFLRDDGKDA